MTKAILFTHIMLDKVLRDYSPEAVQRLINSVQRPFTTYLQCKNVHMVYIYVDTGFRLTIDRLNEDGNISFNIDALEFEFVTRNCLKRAVDECRTKLINEPNNNFDPHNAPKFQFVGLPHLLSIIRTLYRIDPGLTKYLCGKTSDNTPVLTYDSPKFIEAIIRLVRGENDKPRMPIFRVDSDVSVSQDTIDILIDQVDQYPSTQSFAFFSGQYGQQDATIDPINDFAVRTAWLVDPETQEIADGWSTFLKDINELGAYQIEDPNVRRSDAMEALLDKEHLTPAVRRTPQVISGAGLYMSHNAIQQLPPFMNFNKLATWVDDHLKRRLHEVVQHISPDWLESVPEAVFTQNRYPEGVGVIDSAAKSDYFERLFFGCILHSLIVTPEGEPGPLGACVAELVLTGKLESDINDVKKAIQDVAAQKAMQVLDVWSSANYGNSFLKNWAANVRSPIMCASFVDDIVENSLNYIDLVEQWPRFVFAISKLTSINAYWLYR